MNYLDKKIFANDCEYMFAKMCNKRNKLRNCYRPLCCGFCPESDECEGICIPIKEQEIKDDWCFNIF